MSTGNGSGDSRRITLAKRGDHASFEALILAHQDEVRYFVAARTGDWHLVEEVVQIAFVRCYEKIGAYRDTGSFNAWLKGIAHNVLREKLRERTRQRSSAIACIDAMADAYRLEREDAGPTDDDATQLSRLQRCLEGLQPRARELIRRRYEEAIPIKRLAQQFSQTAQSLAAKLKRIRVSLKRCVEQQQVRD